MHCFAANTNTTPPKDPNENGNYIIENFTETHGPGVLRFPAILNFIEKPILKHAKALLQAYNVHLPLSRLKRPDQQIQTKTKPQTKPKPRQKGGKNKTIQYELLILDTMHDFLETQPAEMYKIFKNEIEFEKNVKDSFLKSEYNFTNKAASYIQQKAKINIQNVSFDNETKKHMISTWRDLFQVGQVLDNFVTCFENNASAPLSQGVLTFLGCAYLIVLLSNMKHLDIIPSQCENITLIDGFFMHIDGKYVSRFAVLFTKSLHRLTHLNTRIVPIQLFYTITTPKYFNKLFPEAVAHVNKTHITLNNKQYPIFPKIPIPNQVYYPHTKSEFVQSNKDLWYLNFLRDAFKADVALETSSVFVTHDRFAFTYYKLIGGKQGFLISLELSEDEYHAQLCEYNVAF